MKNKHRTKILTGHGSGCPIEIEAVLSEYRALKIAEQSLCADMDAERQELEARYAKPNTLLIADDPIKALGLIELRKRIATETVRAQLWAETNRERFGKKKSLKFTDAKIGFRGGNPKVELLSKWSWKKALAALQKLLPQFIRNAPEIDKEALLAQRDDRVMLNTITRCGLQIVQEQSFYIDPNMEPIETRATAPAPANIKAA